MDQVFDQSIDTALRTLANNDTTMETLIQRHGRCKLQPHSDYFRELCDAIIGQQLSVKAGNTIVGRFAKLGRGSFPTPDEICASSEDELRVAGLSGAKTIYVKDLAQHVLDGRLDLIGLGKLSNEEIVVRLTDIKGIGEWTAHMFLIFCLARLDILPVGDLGIRKGVKALYGYDELPNPLQLQTTSESQGWTGYESVASWYIWRSLDNA